MYLVVGSGAREHALGYKLAQSSDAPRLFFAPGNAGTAQLGTNIPLTIEHVEDINALKAWAKLRRPDLTVVGPDLPVALGIADRFQQDHLPIFAPSEAAARIESSKAWAAEFNRRHNIPQPDFRIARNFSEAWVFVKSPRWKEFVIKADGLAAGKGVFLPDGQEESLEILHNLMVKKTLGISGETVVFQERIKGKEVSFFAFTDGETVVPLLPATDYKRIGDNDTGGNTGGMGSYAPSFLDNATFQQINTNIVRRMVDGMRKEGYPYKGVIYAGLMLTDKGPMALEFNARFGDPETQPLMMLLSSDLAPILYACIEGTLKPEMVTFRDGAAVCVVLAEKGYPDNPHRGTIIHGLNTIQDPNIQVFHAGTIVRNGQIVTNGGRVLGITAWADDLPTARERAYSVIGPHGIYFDGMQYRTDIAKGL